MPPPVVADRGYERGALELAHREQHVIVNREVGQLQLQIKSNERGKELQVQGMWV